MSQENNSDKIACYIPWQNMIVGADGNVSPCSFYQGFGNDYPFIGNVNEQSIKEIWNGKGYQNLRRFMLSEEGKNGCPGCIAIKQGVCGKPMAPPKPFLEDNPNLENSKAVQNLRLALQEIGEKKTEIQALPASISYTNSHACNYRCTMCYQDDSRALRLEEIQRVDLEILELMDTLIQIIAGGGEPFMLPIWKRFLKDYTPERNPVLTFATTTNGSLLTPETIESVKRFPNVVINFSLDATHKELFEKIRLRSDWDEVYQNLLNCLEQRGPTHNPRFYVSACMTVMRSNFGEIPSFLRMMSQHRMPIGFSPLNVFPIDESLTMFNDPHKDLTWFKNVLTEAKNLFAADSVLQQPFFFEFLKHMHVLEQLIPFHLLERNHYEVEGTLPSWQRSRINPLEIDAVPWVVAIFEEGSCTAKYWAPLERSGNFKVHLPEGIFVGGLTRRNRTPSADVRWRMLVTKNSKSIHDVKPTTIMRLRRVIAGYLPRPIKNTLKRIMGNNNAAPSFSESSACESKKLSA